MSKTVLLADDSVTFHRVVEICLTGEGVTLQATRSAEEAITRARQAPPALVIADTVMPGGRSGYDLAAAMRSDPALSSVPVLLLASPAEPFDEAKARKAGVSASLAKPFQSQAFLEQVRALLNGGQPAASAPSTRPPPRPAGARGPGASVPPPPRPGASVPPPPRPGATIPPPPRPRTMPPPARPQGPGAAARPTSPPPPRGASPATMPPPARRPVPGARPGTMPPPARQHTIPPGARPLTQPPPPRPPAPGASPGAPGMARPQTPGPVAGGRTPAPGATRPPPPRPSAAPANQEALLRDALSKASREMIEKVVWEVVPELAETLIREELERLIKERKGG